MCGFAALISTPSSAPPRHDELASMIDALRHRGPDGTSVACEGRVGLAHARLSIVDLEGGTQPIANEDGTIRVVLNGEIFNHVELRDELQRQGHRFRTRSDTEVLVHLYEEHGDALVERLNGQFAFVIHDARRRRVLVARDRVGIRPVFHAIVPGRGLAVASEAKALFALPAVERRLDLQGLGEVFSLWSPVAPRTCFEGVSQLPPGHRMSVELDDAPLAPTLERWWDWSFEPDASPPDEDDAADALHALLIDAVRLQLRADVPVGAYVSGGLDSSVIATLVRRYTDTPLRTFSLGFADAEFDERPHQQALVAHLGTHHSEIRITREDIADAFPRAVLHAETPLVRTAPTPMMLLAGHVRAAGYKAVLTGEGADEIFAGYDLFKEARIRRFIAGQPASRWRPRILERLYPYLSSSPGRGRAFTEHFFREAGADPSSPWFAHATRLKSTRRTLQFLRPELAARLDDAAPLGALGGRLAAGFDAWPPLGRDQYVEAHTLLPGYLLAAQGDRAAMAHGIEGRYPFLDHRVIEFAGRLPPRMKLRGLREKRLLRAATAPELPPALNQRGKQPYRAPDSACFVRDGRLLPWVEELLSPGSLDAAGLFDAPAVGRLADKCRAGRAIGFPDNMAFVGIVSTMLLHRQFVIGRGTSASP
jgi:asparagine synthase (glutamine-hydrolysing)